MSTAIPEKPLGQKAYGSIGHLPGSKRGPADRGVNDGQARICTVKPRDKHDTIIVQEKLDGTNVAVAKIDGAIVPLIRAGYRAETSHYPQHHLFAAWAYERQDVFDRLLSEGERVCGEWLAQAHGVRYDLTGREPFVAFDIMRGCERALYEDAVSRLRAAGLSLAPLLYVANGLAISVPEALWVLGKYGSYGATEPVEGCVWRVERKGKVDFLAKYVRPDFETGKYLESIGGSVVWNWRPEAA